MSLSASRQPKLRYADYILLPDDGNIHEIIDGDHYMSPAPGTDHQRIGEVFDAPTDLQLSEFDIVQPDLLVTLKDRRSQITPTKIIGPPALVVEILSPSTRARDQLLKFDLYARVGVPEYWIVNPEEREVTCHQLESGEYRETGRHRDTGVFSHAAVVAHVDLTRVWPD